MDQIAAKEAEELQKERRELQAKLKSQEKKVDYFERAKRLEEIPLLQDALKERQIQDQNFWDQQEKERIQTAIDDRNSAVANRDRLTRMIRDKNEFLSKINSERKQIYDDKFEKFEKHVDEERKNRLAERRQKRKEQRMAKYQKEKQEEAERKALEIKRRQEEERKRLEEEARKEKEILEKTEKEEQERKRLEHMEMLNRVAAIQRAREEEIEKKLQGDKEPSKGKPKEDSLWRRGGSDKDSIKKESGLSWRSSEKPAAEEPKKVEAWRRKCQVAPFFINAFFRINLMCLVPIFVF